MSEPGETGAGDHGGAAGADDAYERAIRQARRRADAALEAARPAYTEEEAAALNCSYWRAGNVYVVFLGPLPSLRTAPDVAREIREYGCFLPPLDSGPHVLWLLADPCTYALEHGLHGQKQGWAAADYAEREQRRKLKEQMAAEEAEEKRRGRGKGRRRVA